MDALSDRGSTPLASTIHSHVQWEISQTRMRVSFAALVRVRLSLASIAITGDVGLFFLAGSAVLPSQNRDVTRIARNAIILTWFIYPILKSTKTVPWPTLSPVSRETAGGAGEAPDYKAKPPEK